MKNCIKIILLVIFNILFFNCIDRDRLNPIDPQNPETGGRIRGLRIYSEYDRAVLQWSQLELNGIQGYRIYRKQESDFTFNPIHLVPPDSNQYTEHGLVYDQKYDYFVTVSGDDFETPNSDTVSIIPGPTIIWATDVYNRRILKISHDGTHEIKQIAVDGYPWAVAYDNEKNILWYTDIFLNRVYKVTDQTFEMVLDLAYGEPIDLVLDKSNDRVWVADETQGKIYVFNRQAEKMGEIDGFEQPVSVDCFQSDGCCWIADSKAGTITKISNMFQTIIKIDELNYPTSVSVNQRTGDVWVADSLRVLKFDNKGRLRLAITSSLNLPKCLAVDSESGYCWALDLSFYALGSRLLCFNGEGEQLLELTGFSWPENLRINPYDHTCIVTDSGSGRILKIASNGTIIGQVTGYDYTRGLFIEF